MQFTFGTKIHFHAQRLGDGPIFKLFWGSGCVKMRRLVETAPSAIDQTVIGNLINRTVALMNDLLDAVGDKEDYVLSGLLDLVSELVEEYDTNHFAIEASEPKEVLRYLIEMRGLKQGDLAEIVAQSNLSAILAGRRKISATLAGKLAKYFNVSPAVFVPT